MKEPFFIIGNPRSGTTLLRLMLTCHPNIVVPPECGFAVWWYPKYDNLKNWINDETLIQQFLDDLMISKKIESWQINFPELFKYLITSKPQSYGDIVSSVYEWYGLNQGKNISIWGDKNNFHIRYIHTIKEIFPDTKFLHIIRDGRDVACSYREINRRQLNSQYSPVLPNNIEDIAIEWTNNISTVSNSFQKFDWENVLEILYEDLVYYPEKKLRIVCDWLGEEYSPDMLRFYILNQKEQLEPIEFLGWKEKTIQPLQTNQIGRYKHELSIKEIEIFESIAFNTLDRFGYSRAQTGLKNL